MKKKSEAERHIQAVTTGLIEFSKNTGKLISSPEHAETAICAFLSEFDISCLRAYLRGTAIPDLENTDNTDIVLVSEYVIHLKQAEPERFESFMIMVQGHMLANALICPDLQNVPSTYRDVAFYLDTPLLIRRIGIEGEEKLDAIRELVDLLQKLGGNTYAFSHSIDELRNVLIGAAEFVDRPNGRGGIVIEARRRGTSKSDLLLLEGQIVDKLNEVGIQIKNTPQYEEEFQIDESAFEQALQDEVQHRGSHAKAYDINSVRSIYVLRGKILPVSVEKSRAILVTSNSGFARSAWNYGREHGSSREVSSVITDFSLANLAWLKAPMGAPSIPRSEILAFSYAALQPSSQLLEKYLAEIEKLKQQGEITERGHQILRSSPLVYDELMHLTLGDAAALTNETITEILERVSGEIKKEETERLDAEKEAHQQTQDELNALREDKEETQKNLYWRCHRRAGRYARVLTGFIVSLLLVGFIAGLGVSSKEPIWGLVLMVGFAIMSLLSVGNLLFGSTVKSFHQRVHNWLLTWFLKREAVSTGIDFSPLNNL